MRIAILTPFYPPIVGGISSYVFNLVKTLSLDEDINPDIIVRESKNNKTFIDIYRLGNYKKNDNLRVVNCGKSLFVIKSYKMLYKKEYDALHSHGAWYTLAPCIIYKLFNTKSIVVHTFHTDPINEIKGLKKIVFQWLLFKCNMVTFVSKDLEEKVKENLKIKNSATIYAGVSVKDISKSEIDDFVNSFKLSNCKPVISFVGPLVHETKVKGVQILIKSFKRIVKKYPKAKLLIIGDGGYRKDLEKLAEKLNIQSKVIFTGFIDSVPVPLAVTDIYAHISLQEGLGISILEAMSVGKPVVATRVGGIPEIIVNNENGILVEPDPNEIAKKIIELYNDGEKSKRIGENALLTIEEKFSWDKTTDELIKIYEGKI